MPEIQNRGNIDFSRFDNMTDDELEELLRLDAQNLMGETNTDELLYVMELLVERRKKNKKTEKTAEEAFQSFQENYTPDTFQVLNVQEGVGSPKKKEEKRSWRYRTAVAAALLVVVLCTSVTSKAFGLDVWHAIANWTQEVFHFKSQDYGRIPDPNDNYSSTLDSFYEALEKKKISTEIVPSWIPNEYEVYDINILETPEHVIVTASYKNMQEQKIKIQIKNRLDVYINQTEKDMHLVEIYEVNDVEYYIFKNYDQYCAVWMSEDYECSILGEMNLEQLYQMLDSIQKG